MATNILHQAGPANLSTLLEQIENFINRADYGEALAVLAKAKPLADHRHLGDGACAVLIDGDTSAIPLIKDLSRAGLTLKNDEHGATWLRRIERRDEQADSSDTATASKTATDPDEKEPDLYLEVSRCHSLAQLLFRVIEPIEDDIVGEMHVDPMTRENITHVRRLTLALAEQLSQLEQHIADLPEVSHG